ncbi:Phosphatidylinositol 4-phosphate 5-kinase 2 [Symbiodinium microadriaticum]|uniref:Phosphatidylinositol 4-phosphate 5-kinase 2 n=1 Tax=Symbiodinium microadriaticum TaxID=2951 RepID=A0A1Q9D8A6_SYMMI|nr:Phosphatidylinositol 4-phosphate 5-kinase 2 [Symbiodinium microadriaticum]
MDVAKLTSFYGLFVVQRIGRVGGSDAGCCNEQKDLGNKVIPMTQTLEGRSTREETLSNGAVYVGQWKGSSRDGSRAKTKTWPDGACYEGTFVDNKAAGYGKFVHADGDIYEGEWQDDKAHGHGRYQHIDGSTYEGEWVADKQYQHIDGSTYEGEWVADKQPGRMACSRVLLALIGGKGVVEMSQ